MYSLALPNKGETLKWCRVHLVPHFEGYSPGGGTLWTIRSFLGACHETFFTRWYCMNCEFGFWELLWNIFNFLTASSLNLPQWDRAVMQMSLVKRMLTIKLKTHFLTEFFFAVLFVTLSNFIYWRSTYLERKWKHKRGLKFNLTCYKSNVQE